MEIYRECGYSDRDAAISILENNIFGVDIDKRAYQLAYFAVMMKARNYNRRVFSSGVSCHLAAIEESNGIDRFENGNLTDDKEQNKIGEYLIDAFRDAKEIGSLQTVEQHEYTAFGAYLDTIGSQNEQLDIFSSGWLESVKPTMEKLCKQAEILSDKYAVVCTNPPYMNKLESHLKDFVVTYYKAYSGDLFSVFIYRNFGFCKENGYSAFMTPNVWMFIKTYENLRNYILNEKSIVSLIQMAKGAFFKEATVDICTFILKNAKETEKGLYFRLEDFKGDMEVQKQKVLEALADKNCGYFYETDQSNFSKIPGSPVAYWVSETIIHSFNKEKIDLYGSTNNGFTTGDNERFLRFWTEVQNNKICFDATSHEHAQESHKRWFPYNKGGSFRKWYGNNEYVLNWLDDGADVKAYGHLVPRSLKYQFMKSISWSKISSSVASFKVKDTGTMFDVAGLSLFPNNSQNFYYLLALCNSIYSQKCLTFLSPTLNYETGHVSSIPVIINENQHSRVDSLSIACVQLSKSDWDSYETSWDFNRNPLV